MISIYRKTLTLISFQKHHGFLIFIYSIQPSSRLDLRLWVPEWIPTWSLSPRWFQLLQIREGYKMRKTLKPGNSGGCSSYSWWLFGYGFKEVSRGLLLAMHTVWESIFSGLLVFFFSDCQSQKSESLVCGLPHLKVQKDLRLCCVSPRPGLLCLDNCDPGVVSQSDNTWAWWAWHPAQCGNLDQGTWTKLVRFKLPIRSLSGKMCHFPFWGHVQCRVKRCSQECSSWRRWW